MALLSIASHDNLDRAWHVLTCDAEPFMGLGGRKLVTLHCRTQIAVQSNCLMVQTHCLDSASELQVDQTEQTPAMPERWTW